MTQLSVVLNKFYDEYVNNTPKKLKLIDAYLFYIVLTGVIQFIYCCLVGTFPFNSFLSGFISTVSCFVLGGKLIFKTKEQQLNIRTDVSKSFDMLNCFTIFSFLFVVCLRLQVNPENKQQFAGISPERGFSDFIFAHVILHLVVFNFIG